MRFLDLEPAGAAASGLVRGFQRFRHDALVAARERVVVESPRGLLVAGDKARDEDLRRQNLREDVEALARGSCGEVLALGEHAVEEKDAQRVRRPRRLHVELAPEAAHGFLERVGRAVGLERDRFAVEDRFARGAIAQRRDDFGDAGGDFVQVSRIDADLTARLVRLHARAVELPLESRPSQAFDRVCDVF